MPPRSAYLAWLSVCVIWGTTYLAIRIALETIPPALVGAFRYVGAGAVLMVVLWSRRHPLPRLHRWPDLGLTGLLMIVLGNGGVIWAEQWVSSGIAAVAVASTPFWMIGVEALMPRGEPLSARAVAGVAIGFAGIVLLVWPDLVSRDAAGQQFVLGMVALQIACLGWALGSSYSRRRGGQDDALSAAAVQMLLGGLVMFVIAAVRGEWANLTFTPRSLAAEIYLGAVGSLAGFPAYIYALKHLPVSIVSMYAYANPVIAVLLGALLLAEPFGPRVIGATAAVLLGIAVVRSGTAYGHAPPRSQRSDSAAAAD